MQLISPIDTDKHLHIYYVCLTHIINAEFSQYIITGPLVGLQMLKQPYFELDYLLK